MCLLHQKCRIPTWLSVASPVLPVSKMQKKSFISLEWKDAAFWNAAERLCSSFNRSCQFSLLHCQRLSKRGMNYTGQFLFSTFSLQIFLPRTGHTALIWQLQEAPHAANEKALRDKEFSQALVAHEDCSPLWLAAWFNPNLAQHSVDNASSDVLLFSFLAICWTDLIVCSSSYSSHRCWASLLMLEGCGHCSCVQALRDMNCEHLS